MVRKHPESVDTFNACVAIALVGTFVRIYFLCASCSATCKIKIVFNHPVEGNEG